MCLIIANFAEGKQVTKTVFNDAKTSNPDGIGIMHVSGGKFRVKKFVTKQEQNEAYKYYLRIRAMRPAVNIVIHFRFATHGVINPANCHPFKVNDSLYVCHNGILDIDQPNVKFSDTWHFVKHVLSAFPVGFEKLTAYKLVIESFIDYSKLCFLNSKGDVYIHNVQLGGYDGGNWYSNTKYKCSPKPEAKPVSHTSTLFNDEGYANYNYQKAYWLGNEKFTDYDAYQKAVNAKYAYDKANKYLDGTKDTDISDQKQISVYDTYKAKREKELLQEREAKKMERFINGQWRPVDTTEDGII